MKEIGFWDYTCPKNGSLERYTRADWDLLLDDMVAGGWNSFVLCPKWLTTGYRSRYDWLDQDPECSAINTDNDVVHYALQGARKRGMKVWILVVASIFQVKEFGIAPDPNQVGGWLGSSAYDLDHPIIFERAMQLFEEIGQLFGKEADGIIVEVEFGDTESERRIPIYNEWAKQNNRPDFATIKNIVLQPRSYPFGHWRDFTTSRRIETFKHVEQVLRKTGFTGRLTTIAEIDNGPMAVVGNMNLPMYRDALPHWSLVTYDSIYDRRVNRLATMDFCVVQPRALGLEVQYIARGVMTFPLQPFVGPTTLEQEWTLMLEDAKQFDPDALWFMGSDARFDGAVCSDRLLPQWGEADGRSARLKLMKMAREKGVRV